jgi:hypothetical protein
VCFTGLSLKEKVERNCEKRAAKIARQGAQGRVKPRSPERFFLRPFREGRENLNEWRIPPTNWGQAAAPPPREAASCP